VAISGDSTAADTLELFAEALDQATGQLDSGTLHDDTITAASIATGAIGADAIADGAIDAGAIAASALNGKGNWNVGKTGYSLTANTGLGNQTANITGNLSGSVGSVTGAVGSVTGAVGSVTGNVGGNVTGTVGGVAGTITTLDGLNTSLSSAHGAGSWATATGFSTHSADDVRTAMEANGSKLDHLWEMTEDDGGTRRLTENALEEAPAGGGSAPTVEEIRAEMDSNSTQLAAIVADTNELQTNQGDWATATGFSTHDANDVLTALGNGSWATEAGGTGDQLTALATQASVDDLPTNAELDTALAGADDAVLAAIAALNDLSAADVNAQVLDVIATDTLVDGKSIQAALRYIAAVVAGKLSGAGSGTETVKGLDGATNRATFTVDASGNRTAVSYDP
jgi:hypothetical protein